MDLEIEKCATADDDRERGFVWFSYLRLRKGWGIGRVGSNGRRRAHPTSLYSHPLPSR